MSLPPDLAFGLALAILGVVMLSVVPPVAVWLGVLLVLAAISYAQVEGKSSGHSLIGDVTKLLGVQSK